MENSHSINCSISDRAVKSILSISTIYENQTKLFKCKNIISDFQLILSIILRFDTHAISDIIIDDAENCLQGIVHQNRKHQNFRFPSNRKLGKNNVSY